MIVRIATDGQYELLESDGEALEELDRQAITACESGDEEQFRSAFSELIDFVHRNGQPLSDDQLVGSDVILPPSDSSLAEARAEFDAEGLIPD